MLRGSSHHQSKRQHFSVVEVDLKLLFMILKLLNDTENKTPIR